MNQPTISTLLAAAHALSRAGYERSDIAVFLDNYAPFDQDPNRRQVADRAYWRMRFDKPGHCWAYVLEFSQDNGATWAASEIDDGSGDGKNGNNYWEIGNWFGEDLQVGWFADYPGAWLCSSCDWSDRLGVDFDARYTPTERPSPVGVWGGVTDPEIYGGEILWRVRRVRISCALGERQREWIMANPTARWVPKEYEPEA